MYKKEWNPTISIKMDETGGYHARNKPETEKQMPQVLPYMWELNLKEPQPKQRMLISRG